VGLPLQALVTERMVLLGWQGLPVKKRKNKKSKIWPKSLFRWISRV